MDVAIHVLIIKAFVLDIWIVPGQALSAVYSFKTVELRCCLLAADTRYRYGMRCGRHHPSPSPSAYSGAVRYDLFGAVWQDLI